MGNYLRSLNRIEAGVYRVVDRASGESATMFIVGGKQSDDSSARTRNDDPRGTHGEVWELGCLEHEGGCGATMHGDSRIEVLAKWNHREPPNDALTRGPSGPSELKA